MRKRFFIQKLFLSGWALLNLARYYGLVRTHSGASRPGSWNRPKDGGKPKIKAKPHLWLPPIFGFYSGGMFLGVWVFLFAACGLSVFAQSPAPPNNQLIQLMMSQPQVDISSPVTATATFDPPVVRPGEKSIYRVSLNAPEASIQGSAEISAPSLKLQRITSGEIVQQNGGMLRTLTTFNFDARAPSPGRFTVPEQTLEVYGQPVVVPAATLDAQAEPAAPHEPARQLLLEAGATNLYVGETFTVRVLLPGTSANAVESLSQVQLNGDGFVVDKNAVRQSIQMLANHGRSTGTFIYETSVTPIAPGTLPLFAQGFTAGMQFGGPIVITGQVTIPGGPPKYLLLNSEAVAIQVRPLPGGALPGFAGAVGSFICPPPQLATNLVRVGDPVQLNVTIRGQQNLNHLTPPRPPSVNGWQIFPAVRAGNVGNPGTPDQGVLFSYTLIPTTTGLSATPAIPFSCFDPRLGAYVDLTIAAVPITVVSNEAVSSEASAAVQAESALDAAQKKSLSEFAVSPGRTTRSLIPLQVRAWFPLIPLLQVLAFCALGMWDRRRRYLEQHPEIVRRQQARRELRRVKRALKKTAAANDAPGFTHVAVSALQIVCAPHYPAEPRALVGGDVLEILSAPERTGRAGELVRRIFAAGDAASFATAAPGDDGLLGQHSALEEVLAKLEARL